MPMLVTTFELKDPAQVRDWGLALVQWCRVNRALPNVVNAQYWGRGMNSAVVLIQYEQGSGPTMEGLADNPEFAKAAAALQSMCNSSPFELWNDAQGNFDVLRAGGG